MSAKYPVLCSALEVVAGVNDQIVLYEPNGASPGKQTATVAAGTYYVYQDDDGGEAANNLLTAVVTAIDTASGTTGNGYAYSWSLTLRQEVDHTSTVFSATSDTDNFRIDASDADCTFPVELIGLEAGADTGSVSDIVSSLSSALTWVSSQPRARIDPGGWERDVHQHVAADGSRHTFTASDVREMRRLRLENIERGRVFEAANSADPGRAFEAWWRLASDGRLVRLYEVEPSSATLLPDLTSSELVGTYVLTQDSCTGFDPRRPDDAVALYSWDLMLAKDQ